MSKIKLPGLCLLVFTLFQCSQPNNYLDEIYEKPPLDPDPAAPSLSPEESMETIYLPKGFALELVASEPMIEEPIDIAWDGDGKMYVAEMLTYMQDIDATNENEPWSRVSVLEDTNGDGKMDKSTVFVDSLLLPRIILPLDDRVIISETYEKNFWSYRDTDGDRVADEKVLIFENTEKFRGNLEHQAANLTWNIDNWLYLSKDAFRYRWNAGKLETDTIIDSTTGQYGLTQDEVGKMYYSRAGGEVVALGFQQHPVYGTLEMDGRWEEGFEQPWPLIGTPDVQGGERRLRPDRTLNKFTGVAGQEIFLGDRLPAYGDLFVPEPVGRLVRRATVNNVNGKKVLSNPYDKTEFMASTDPNFRPVRAATGPDGCLYIVDMYRGIIQEGNWTREGSYLRPEVKRRNLDKNIGKGRIYRVVHEQMNPYKPIKLLNKSSSELIGYLGHSNGWYRLTAQKLLVIKNDHAIVPELKGILMDNESFLATLFSDRDFGIQRLHALWTLDGMGKLDKQVLVEKLKDKDHRVRSAAIRIGEKFLKNGDQEFLNSISQMSEDSNIDVLVQLVLSSKLYSEKSAAKSLIDEITVSHPNNEVIGISAKFALSEIGELQKKYALKKDRLRASVIKGYEIYKGLCATCHGPSGEGKENLAPSLVNSARMMDQDQEIPIKILLDGLSGPVDGKEYGIMVSMKGNDDQWIADILTYVRAEFGGIERRISPTTVGKVREKHKNRDKYWTIEELYAGTMQ
ncbi:MAG: c-type cytochrome [Cyclobacteriaceae bacterium]